MGRACLVEAVRVGAVLLHGKQEGRARQMQAVHLAVAAARAQCTAALYKPPSRGEGHSNQSNPPARRRAGGQTARRGAEAHVMVVATPQERTSTSCEPSTSPARYVRGSACENRTEQSAHTTRTTRGGRW